MALSNIDFYFIAAYFLAVIFIGYLSSRRETKEGFLIGDRNLSSINLAATLSAGFVGGGFLVLFVGIAYVFGLSAIWLVIGQALGLIIFAIFGKKIKEMGDEKKFYTLSDYFYNKFDRKTGILISIMIFLFFMGFIIIQFIAGGRILSGITTWPYHLSVLVVGIVILFYLTLGGFKAVVKTDLFQYLVILFFMFVVGTSLLIKTSFLPSDFNILSIGIVKIIAFLLFGIFFVIIAADVWQ